MADIVFNPITGDVRAPTRLKDAGDGTFAEVRALTADQDPIPNHTGGKVTSVTASAVILNTPAGCKFAEISAPGDIWVRTDDVAAVVPVAGMAGVPILVAAGQTRIVPVTPGTAVRAISASGAAVLVVVVPLKVRA